MKKLFFILYFFVILTFLYSDDFVLVNAGILQMQDDSNLSKREFSIDSFYICKHEVTQKEWMMIMGNNPSYEQSDSYPVNMVSWIDAIIYCNKRSLMDGLTPCYEILDSKIKIGYDIPWEETFQTIQINEVICNWNANGYRLPTELEWEYAAKSEGKDNFYFSGSNNIDDVAWYYDYIGATIHDVMTKQPNNLGIYDMSGNVSEWCWDWYTDSIASNNINLQNSKQGTAKVHRGGSWSSEVWEKSIDEECSVSKRAAWVPTMKDNNLGFRLVRSAMQQTLGTLTNVEVNKTMSVKENLKLRSAEVTSSNVLNIMAAGTIVKVLELGKEETIDDINSNWVKVEIISGKDRDGNIIRSGTTGWCYGGYLE